MGLNVEYPRLDLLLSVADVRKVIADLLWIEENLKMRVDILEALPKCVFPEDVLKSKHSFLNRKCQAGRTVIAVSCNGDVRPCAHNPYSYGNLLKEDLRNIWQQMSEWRSAKYVPEECKDCSWLNRCNGGCRTSAKVYSGDWDKKDMWCTGKLTMPAPRNEQPEIELQPDTQLQIVDNIKIRHEDENAYVIYNVTDDVYCMVNQTFHDFVVSLQELPITTFGELCCKFDVLPDDKYINDAITFLINKKILKIIK